MTKQSKHYFIWSQWLAGTGVTLLILQLGFLTGCISPLLAKYTDPGSPIFLTFEEASWVASLVNFGRFLGAIVGSVSTNYIGPKKSIFATLIPIALGWLGIAMARDVSVLYAARIFSGIGFGMAFSSFPLYIGEVSIPEIRGALVSLAWCGSPFGQLIGSAASSYLDTATSAYVYLGLCLLLMAIFLWLPESPHHLVKNGNEEAARKSVDWYRSGNGVEEELLAIKEFVASESSIGLTERLREFRNPGTRRALSQVIVLFAFMQICGFNSIIFYMVIILRSAKCDIVEPADMFIYLNVCAVLATATSVFLVDRCGRRFLMMVSGIGIALSMSGMSSHFLCISMQRDVSNLQWLPVLSMVVYMTTFFMGVLSVPSTVLSEIFPASVKCIAACIASFTAGVMSFLSAKTYQPMVDLVGEAYVFLMYAIFGVAMIPYVLFVMPETKGKSLQRIQDELMRK